MNILRLSYLCGYFDSTWTHGANVNIAEGFVVVISVPRALQNLT